jgi:hypothetical protein
MHYIEHQVLEMDESMIQRCLFCGEVIANYNNVMFLGSPPKGWPAGSVFVTAGNPRHFTKELGVGETSESCAKV